MTWCDKLASTPAVGYQFEAHFASGDRILDSLSPMTDTWANDKKPLFTVSRHESFHIELQHDNGFQYNVNETKASVTFQHRLKLRNTSAGLPVAEFISQPLQFSRLLSSAFDEVVKMTMLLPQSATRRVNRVGIVAQTIAVKDDLPPGLIKLLDYFAKPWQNGLHTFNVTVTANLRDDDRFTDRCVHHIGKMDGDDENLITVRLDWQRSLKKPMMCIPEDMRKLNLAAERAALEYFEDLAVGNSFDEHIIGTSTEN